MKITSKSDFCRLFGITVRRARLKKGMRTPAITPHIGISRYGLHLIEKGETAPGFLTVCRLAKILEIDLNEFVDLAPAPDAKEK